MVIDDEKEKQSGFRKIMDFRDVAANRGYDWCWADTICIDKSSSAELSEAINSMYKWYRSSASCYVYLSDVDHRTAFDPSHKDFFGNSAWFTRGWTLQELLAPYRLAFYDASWERLGDLSSLSKWIGTATGIPPQLIPKAEVLRSFPVPDLIALAATRNTSRVEDRAYSLLGMLGVNMPLLYGEGRSSFGRLQETLIQRGGASLALVHSGPNILADKIEDFVMHTEEPYKSRRQAPNYSYRPKYRVRSCVRGIFPGCVEMAADFLNITKKQSDKNLYRLLAMDFKSKEDENLPTYLLIFRRQGDELWEKVCLIGDRRERVEASIRALKEDDGGHGLLERAEEEIRFAKKRLESGKNVEDVFGYSRLFVYRT
jgi:hypothetical protein